MAVLEKPFLYKEWELAATFSVGREMIWLHYRRAAALALPMVGPGFQGFWKLLPTALMARLVTHQTLKD